MAERIQNSSGPVFSQVLTTLPRDAARSTGDETEGGWQRAIYQPPERSKSPNDDSSTPVEYKAEHDIYSLGVILVEIGRWETVGDVPPTLQNRITSRTKEATGRNGRRATSHLGSTVCQRSTSMSADIRRGTKTTLWSPNYSSHCLGSGGPSSGDQVIEL